MVLMLRLMSPELVLLPDFWLVGCGLASHSAIFQLYSDGIVVQFRNFDLLPGTQRHGQLGVFSVPSLPRHGHRDVRRRFNLLAIRGPARGEGMPGIEHRSSDPWSSPLPLRPPGWLRTFEFQTSLGTSVLLLETILHQIGTEVQSMT